MRALFILCFTALAANMNIAPGKDAVAITDANKADADRLAPTRASWNRINNAGANNGSSDQFYGAAYNNVNNSGPHGFTEILYTYTSATGNNGSAFAGITVNTPFYNLTIGIAMLIGRFLMIIPLLAIAGSLAKKKIVPQSAGTFPVTGPLFAGLLVATVVIVGALTFFPALSLGPILEHLLMAAGKSF